MTEQAAVWLESTPALSTAVSVVSKRDDLQVCLGTSKPRFYRLPRSQLLLLLLLLLVGVGLALTVVYLNWSAVLQRSWQLHTELSNETLAQRLEREVRIVCWVLTTPKYHKSRAIHVLRTWGRRCNKIYFMSSEPDDELQTIVLTKPDSYNLLWGKTKEAFTYLYENKLHEGDWFMKADDDTYVFVENLRSMLYPYSPDMPIHFGFKYKLQTLPEKNASYMSGGSGYVLSREALRVFVHGLNDSSKCRQEDDSPEDLEMGTCLYKLGVLAGDSRDAKLQNRFLPMEPFSQLISHYTGLDFWFFSYAYYDPRPCLNCLSDYPVAFHYVSPEILYVYEYFNYEFERYGRRKGSERLPAKIAPDQLVIPLSDNTIT